MSLPWKRCKKCDRIMHIRIGKSFAVIKHVCPVCGKIVVEFNKELLRELYEKGERYRRAISELREE